MNKIIYLDAAASALKPQAVIDAEMDFLKNHYANAGRGVCARAAGVDTALACARAAVAQFIGASPDRVIFTAGTTDGMNRIVHIVQQLPLFSGGRIPTVAVSDLDHHSARMPWQNLANAGRCKLAVCALNPAWDIDIEKVPMVDVMVITAMSNVLGRAQDVAAIIRAARRQNKDVITIVDAAQYVAHRPIDVTQWDCDFMCFSGHKIGADTGVGVMYVKNPDKMPADKFGGGMVNKILESGQFMLNPAPEKFEAGTLPLTQIVGLGPAIKSWRMWSGGADLVGKAHDELSQIPRINLLTRRDASLVSFTVQDMHVLDLGVRAGARGLCMRVGNMCATWIHQRLGIGGSARLSVGPWNTPADVEGAIEIIKGIVK